MATGRGMQLTRQIGESLVAAELGRCGLIATPFAGNVPDFDIIAIDAEGKLILIQVKTIRGGSWQFDIRSFLDVELQGDSQIVKGKKEYLHCDMLCVFVGLGEDRNQDEFYVFPWSVLQDHFYKTYKGGRRPRNPKSFHCAVWPKDLAEYRDSWQIIVS